VSADFSLFLPLGFRHIADLRSADHILFVAALTAAYAPREWTRIAWLVTAFTVGHSVSLALTTVERQDAKDIVGDKSKGTGYYRFTIEQKGGLVMPVEMEITYTDGTRERVALPADIWRMNEKVFTHGMFTSKDVAQVVLDPDLAFADVNRDNNTWKKPAAAARLARIAHAARHRRN
jgi:hypothetical protein